MYGALRLWFAVFALITAAHQAQGGLPVETFVDKPALVAPKISPSGRHMATPLRAGERMVIAVHDLDARQGAKPTLIYTEDLEIEWIEWANDERLIASFLAKVDVKLALDSHIPKRIASTWVRRLVAVDRDGGKPVVLMTPDRRFRANFDLTSIVHMLPDEPQHVLMAANDPRGRFNLYRVNINTGEIHEVVRGNERTDSWLTDLKGAPRARWDFDRDREAFEMYLRRGDGAEWDKVAVYGERDLPDVKVVGFGDDPKVAIVASRQASDRLGLYEYDIAARRLGRLLFSHPTVDVGSPFGSLIYDRDTTRLLGLTYVEDLWRVHYFDAELSRIQADAEAILPDTAVVRLQSWSADKTRVVVYAEGPTNPGSYHFYDRKAKRSELIGRLHPRIVARELGDVATVRYPAADGTKITGYLTLPPGMPEKNLPMVVFPHGGPEMRDSVRYDETAQWMANQGYLVFQPNFRGSGGYGRAFAEAGHRQWGRRMQDDVTEGVKALIADGTVDPRRICIVGASYGGYAALAGGAFTPDLYKCVASIAGVADLVELVEDERRTMGADSTVYAYWVKRIGDPERDAAEMTTWSPVTHAAKFTAPVLLIHSKNDAVVPYGQSETMARALKRAGKQVKLVTAKGEGHDFASRSGRRLLLTELQRFLAEHLSR